MLRVTRVSISVEETLLEKFDAYLAEQGFPTRSEAIKSLMRGALVQREWADDETIAATITIVYDHHKSGLLTKLVEAQHGYGELVLCSQHAHLDHHNCMETIIVRGRGSRIQELYRSISAIKGLKYTDLSAATTGKNG